MIVWLARDQDGSLWVSLHEKPFKGEKKWYNRGDYGMIELDDLLFPSVKWKDNEATEVELKIKFRKKGGER